MIDPRSIASRLLGSIDWRNEVSGFCHCPGETLHTSRTGPKDCRVNLDGVPTVYCFHASCSSAVSVANRQLRRELSASPWRIRISGGASLRSGDLLQAGGAALSRETVLTRGRTEGRDATEALILESVRMMAERFRPELFEVFQWPLADIAHDSPLNVCELGAQEQFRAWLQIWPSDSHIWIGDVFSSGRPEHRIHFRPVVAWDRVWLVTWNFTCGSSFKAGSYSRCNANLASHRFLVVESDTLGKDEVGAVFNYLRLRLKYRLRCIIDTAGKSLHAWFDAPRSKILENRLKAGLTAFGCDPKVFTYSQPVRVPGARRDGKLQHLLWLEYPLS